MNTTHQFISSFRFLTLMQLVINEQPTEELTIVFNLQAMTDAQSLVFCAILLKKRRVTDLNIMGDDTHMYIH